MESEQTRREMQRPPASRGEEPGLGGRRVCAPGALTCAGVLTPATRVRIDVTAHALRKGPPASRQRHSRYKDAAGVRLGVAQVPAATQGRGGGGCPLGASDPGHRPQERVSLPAWPRSRPPPRPGV